ncbi:hypothetical protein LZ32DRAFT_144219 [Colletotrichum eremochloae]|nr:hypothetical protein LZ32DRAFT_144219 [Colletotrichum eremochloae]
MAFREWGKASAQTANQGIVSGPSSVEFTGKGEINRRSKPHVPRLRSWDLGRPFQGSSDQASHQALPMTKYFASFRRVQGIPAVRPCPVISHSSTPLFLSAEFMFCPLPRNVDHCLGNTASRPFRLWLCVCRKCGHWNHRRATTLKGSVRAYVSSIGVGGTRFVCVVEGRADLGPGYSRVLLGSLGVYTIRGLMDGPQLRTRTQEK